MKTLNICKNNRQQGPCDPTIKIESFGPHAVFNFRDDFDNEKWALKAFGELLATSSLDRFSDTEGYEDQADAYRNGLRQIINLYLFAQFLGFVSRKSRCGQWLEKSSPRSLAQGTAIAVVQLGRQPINRRTVARP